MQIEKDVGKINQKKPNFLSRLLFCWELPIIFRGWRKKLTEKDLRPAFGEYDSERLGNKLEKVWLEELKKGTNCPLMKTFIKVFGIECWIYGLLLFPIDLCLALVQPFLLKKLLDYHTPNQTDISKQEAYYYASCIVILSLIYILIFHTAILELYNLGMKKTTVGKIINLLANDVYRLDLAFSHFHYMWMSPIKILASIYYLHDTFGYTAVAGITAIVVALLVQIHWSRKAASVRKRVAAKTDHRIRLMSDIINSMQLIKMCTWEKPFSKLVNAARRLEIKEVTQGNHLRICSSIIKIYVPKISVFLCVLASCVANLPLTSQYVFSLTNLYENLKFTAIIRMPTAFFRFAEAKISVKRIEEFLLLNSPKVDNYVFKSTHDISGVSVQNVSVKWDQSLPNNTLSEVNFCAFPGEIVAIIGPPGSGKTSLLQVILNELDLVEGVINIGGRVSYSSQEPWIFSGSIKENILFGLDMQRKRYSQVLRITALNHDLSQFPYGDNTCVGEKGVTLSGGQKARINLARAIYRDADVYLLDDPLSTVDAHVAKHIFRECIQTYLKDKCVILVTHQVQYLQNVNKVYVLEAGRVSNVIKPQEFASIKPYHENEEESLLVTKESDKEVSEVKIMEEKSGAAKDYVNYFAAGGRCIVIISILLLLAFNQVLGYLIDYFVTFWVNSAQNISTPKPSSSTNYLCIYGLLIVALTLSTHLGSWTFVKFCGRVSKTFHDTLFTTILHAPIKFFHDHSSGNIMNWFSKDVGNIDEFIPTCLNEVITQLLMVFGLTVVICYLNHHLIIPSLFLYVVFYYCAVIFQPSNICIRRIEGNSRSPIFAYLTTSIHGLTTIKALNAERTIEREFNRHQDYHTSSFILFRSLFASFGFWVDVILLLYTGAVTFSFFFIKETHVGDVGLAVTLSTILGGMIQLGMKSWGELDSYISSVERVVEYTKIPQETKLALFTPRKSWPENGNISFQNVSMRYSIDSSLVLKEVTFKIKSGEKIGIVGRTGAGKTSLLCALFRLFEFEGVISIDEIDIKSVSLSTLRSKISIIPQDPVLFLGSLRKNLDPFGEFSDFQLWHVLEEVQLKEVVSSLLSGLDTQVSEGGSNFSVGQRQLLCLVRTMLRRDRIIVLDEATANVDFHTDRVIQSTIRKRFENCTVLTIAHRLNTVADCDKILVMEDGRVVEFRKPEQLLDNSGIFVKRYVKKDTK